MLEPAGLGIAFHAKPNLTDASDTYLTSRGLDRVHNLLAQPDRDISDLQSK